MLGVAGAIGLYGLALLAASFLPPSVLLGDLRQFAGGGGDPAAAIAARYGAIASHARLAGVGLLLLAGVIALTRRGAGAWLAARQGEQAPPGGLRGLVQWGVRACRARPWEAGAALAIATAGIALRLYYVGRALRHDEAWTYMFYARMPVYLIPIRYTDVNDHVLNTLLIHISTSLFGDALPFVRLPALLFGIACIPAGYALARALAGRGAAIIAAALIATATPLVEFSVNARGYTALSFFFLCVLWAGYTAITEQRTGRWLVVALCGALGLYTIPTMMIPLFGAMVWFGLLALAARRDRGLAPLRDVILAGVLLGLAAVLLYTPILVANGVGTLVNSHGIHASNTVAGAVAALPGYAPRLLANWDRGFGFALGMVLVVLAPLSVVLARGGRRALGLLILALACALVAQLIGLKDVGPYRIWLPFLPVLLILAAASIDGILRLLADAPRRPAAAAALPMAAAVCLCVFAGARTLNAGMILSSGETAFFPEARLAAGLLAQLRPGDVVGITNVRSDEIHYYAHRMGIDLAPVKVGDRLRYFVLRPHAGKPAAPAPETHHLYLLVDGVFDDCQGAACAGRAAPDWRPGSFQQGVEMLPGGQDFVFMRTALP